MSGDLVVQLGQEALFIVMIVSAPINPEVEGTVGGTVCGKVVGFMIISPN